MLPETRNRMQAVFISLDGPGINGTSSLITGGYMMVISGISEVTVTARVAKISSSILVRDRMTAAAGWRLACAGAFFTLTSISTVDPALGTAKKQIWMIWTA